MALLVELSSDEYAPRQQVVVRRSGGTHETCTDLSLAGHGRGAIAVPKPQPQGRKMKRVLFLAFSSMFYMTLGALAAVVAQSI